MNDATVANLREIQAIVARIKPILAGREPQVVGAALADLFSIWIANHICESAEETPAMREMLIADWLDTMRKLIVVNEKMILAGMN